MTSLDRSPAEIPTDTLPAREVTGTRRLRAVAPRPEELPNRYEVRPTEDARILRCKEAPGVAVLLDRGYAFTEPDARKLGERVILLDGAGQFAPLVDNAQSLYNLDHHSACLRAFTLATCEQALILVLKGLELDKGDWTIYANEPDLDTVFAIWVLLNYRRVRELGPEQRDAILPLLRLEGAIDANGLEIGEYCGLPTDRLQAEKQRLDLLFQREIAAKKGGRWETEDLPEYTRGTLYELDRLVYTGRDFRDYTSVETEHGHVNIGQDKVAVVCRDSIGIYEVEKRLKRQWGDRLGIIALEREPNHYTLRLVAALAGIDLDQAYERLNLLDPVVDGRPPEKRWGGSDDIGGSPRPVGTGLTPREICKILKLTYRKVSTVQRLQRLATAALWTVGLTLAAGMAVFARRFLAPSPLPEQLEVCLDLAMASLVSAAGAGILCRQLSRGWTWLFGLRLPAARDWLALYPPVLLAGAVGAVWVPRGVTLGPDTLLVTFGAILLGSLAVVLWFPGLVHGLLVLEAPVQTVGGRWFISRPAMAVGLLYALVTLAAAQVWIPGSSWPVEGPSEWAVLLAGGFLGGTSLAMIRERSSSVWPCVGAILSAAAVWFLVAGWMPV